jgi:hypothetical protein
MEDEMDGACGTHGREEKCKQVFWEVDTEGEILYWRPRYKCNDNIKMFRKEIGWEGVDWIFFVQVGPMAGCY